MHSEILRKIFADALTSRQFFEVMFALYNVSIGKIILLEERKENRVEKRRGL